MVFLHHYGGGAQSSFLPLRVFGQAVQIGWAGVSLFFVLSGFLITGILWDSLLKPNWWRRFYIRRSLRIFPLYYFAIIVGIIAAAACGIASFSTKPILIYVFYLQDIPALRQAFEQFPRPLILDHFWSLAVEEQFYLIWPFLLLLCRQKLQRARNLCVMVWILSLGFRLGVVYMDAPLEWAQRFLVSRSGELAAGSFLALSVRGDETRVRERLKFAPWAFFSSLIVIVAAFMLSGALDLKFSPMSRYWLVSTIGISAIGVFFASLLALTLNPGLLKTIFEMRFLRWLGKISYGIYVYHVLLRPMFDSLANRIVPRSSVLVHQATLAIIATIGTLTIATVSFYTLERMFNRLKGSSIKVINPAM